MLARQRLTTRAPAVAAGIRRALSSDFWSDLATDPAQHDRKDIKQRNIDDNVYDLPPNSKKGPMPELDLSNPFNLSPKKRVNVGEYMDMVLVDIREVFFLEEGSAAGSPIPTKKGISLTVPQWERLKACMPEIDKQIAGRTELMNVQSGASSTALKED